MFTYPDLIPILRDLQSSNIVISPWLAGVNQDGRFDSGLYALLEQKTHAFADRFWTESEKIAAFHNQPIPERLARTAVYETVSSTAVFLASEQQGTLEVTPALADQAFTLVTDFIHKHTFHRFVLTYELVTSFENFQALAHYHVIPEREFLMGNWHRPWIDYTLDDELLVGTYLKTIRTVVRDGKRYVELTDDGRQNLAYIRNTLETAGYLKQRLQTLRISQFDRFENYEKLAEELVPNFMALREELRSWSDIQPGMKVLELGCGSGALTFQGGLALQVGQSGQVIAIDPSQGMIARANRKRQELGYDWVSFQVAKAEQLPFPDHDFDVAIGSAFLHFTDTATAFRELKRVLKPGGILMSLHPLQTRFVESFFQEWFEPILAMAMKRNEAPRNYLHNAEYVLDMLRDSGYANIESRDCEFINLYQEPDKVIAGYIEGVGLFQEELADLPWQARIDLLEELRRNGYKTGANYNKENLVLHFPGQMIKARIPQSKSNSLPPE